MKFAMLLFKNVLLPCDLAVAVSAVDAVIPKSTHGVWSKQR